MMYARLIRDSTAHSAFRERHFRPTVDDKMIETPFSFDDQNDAIEFVLAYFTRFVIRVETKSLTRFILYLTCTYSDSLIIFHILWHANRMLF